MSPSVDSKKKFKLHTVADLQALPPTEWLIDGVMETHAQAVLYGPSGEGKSFLALDWALSIATGRPWRQREVTPGQVIYVVAEGGKGVRKRVAAWQAHHNVPTIAQSFFVLEAVQFLVKEDVALLLSRIHEAQVTPALIVVDTLARCFVGGEENSAKDMGEFMDAVRRLQTEASTAVLLVHHTGKTSTDIERGSSALRGAVDTMILARKKGEIVSLRCTKQRDEEEFKPIHLRLKRVELPSEGEKNILTSCVLVQHNGGVTHGTTVDGLNPSLCRALKALALIPAGYASSGDWRIAISQKISPKTFNNWRKALVEKAYVEELPEKPHHYALTEKGLAIANGLLSASQEKDPTLATPATPP